MNKGLCSGVILALLLAGSSFSEKPTRPGGEEQLTGWPSYAISSLEFGVLLPVEAFASRIDVENETDHVAEAYLMFGASETIPYDLVAGRFYQPVGNFESVFISDPLLESL